MIDLIKKPVFYIYLAWLQVAAATFGSLYFSEILRFAPCVLCWYQRIFTYPLLILIPMGLYLKDKNMPYYVFGVALPGFFVAIYQNLLYYKLIPSGGVCLFNVSCTTQYINYFGFITIPLLALISFVVILGSMVIAIKLEKANV